jgi:hypothetical protein
MGKRRCVRQMVGGEWEVGKMRSLEGVRKPERKSFKVTSRYYRILYPYYGQYNCQSSLPKLRLSGTTNLQANAASSTASRTACFLSEYCFHGARGSFNGNADIWTC